MKIIKWILALILVLGFGGFIYAAVKINQPATTTSHPQDFEISKGQKAGEIVDLLAEKKIVRSEMPLEIYLRYNNAEKELQAGTYTLDSNMSIPEIVEVLTQGKVKSQGVRVTVIEGWTAKDIAAALEEKGVVAATPFLAAAQSKEGFLFPDTYIFRENSSAEVVLQKMLDNFKTKVPEIDYDTLTLASIIEREVGRNVKKGTSISNEEKARIQEERRIVAGIFLKRLELGMPLESDATISYITGRKGAAATFEELKIDSPYNTYKYRGLPPTPISNPSLDSIRAAIHPLDTDYFFFLTDASGQAYFARTLSEHIRNREQHLE